MRILILLLGFFLILVFSRIKMNRIERTVIICILLFFINVLLLSTFNWYGIYEVSSYTYLLWIINIFMFSLGFCIKKNKEKENGCKNSDDNIDKIINSTTFVILGVIIIIGLIYYKIRFDNIVKGLKTVEEIRMIKFKNLFNSGVEYIIYEYFITTFTNIYTIFFAILLVDKKIKNKVFFMSIIIILLYIMIGYGRKILFDILIYIIMYSIIKSNGVIKLNFKYLIKLFVIGFMIFSIAIIATAVRLGVKLNNHKFILNNVVSEQIKQNYLYFVGGFRLLDQYIGEFDNNYTLGRMTLGGVDDIVGIPFLALNYDYKPINTEVGKKLQKNILIGNNTYMNAFYTCVMNFYSDFGILGVIIIPLVYGVILKRVINKAAYNKNLYDILIFLYITCLTVSAVYRWFYQLGSGLFTIIIIMFIKSAFEGKRDENEIK